MTMTTNRSAQVLTFLISIFIVNESTLAQKSGSDSAYVVRMMSLDRNGDGVLQASELPGKLAELLQEHDSNSDASLDRSELAGIEAKAQSERMPTESVGNADANRNRTRQAADGMRRGGRNGGRRAGASSKASPLDVEQILRFALTFDVDKDGGLNAEEIKRYATALAARRAVAQQNRAKESGAEPAKDEAPKGLGAPGLEKGGDPFGG